MSLRRNRYPSSRIIYYLPASLWYAAALLASARLERVRVEETEQNSFEYTGE